MKSAPNVEDAQPIRFNVSNVELSTSLALAHLALVALLLSLFLLESSLHT